MAAVPSDMSATLPTMISFISFAEGAFNPILQVVAEDAKPYVSDFFFSCFKVSPQSWEHLDRRK